KSLKESIMKRFKNHLFAAALLSALAIIGAIMNSHQAAAQGPPNGLAVNIVNPVPVPVTGSLGITGTPNVPVTNPATTPVLALNVNDPGRIPYQKQQTCIPQRSGECIAPFLNAIPANHRLVVQHVSISTAFSSAQSSAEVQVHIPTGSGLV